MISLEEKIFDEEANYVSFEKFIEESKTTLGCKVLLSNKQFSGIQQDIYKDILWDIVEYLQWEDIYFEWIRTFFESKLQELNTKLQAFAEKMESEERFGMQWVLHMIVQDQYLSALIGASSLMIFRDQKLIYTFWNEQANSNIDQFSETIEWDLEDEDKLLIRWSDINTYLDDEDLKKVSELTKSNSETTFVQQLLDIISVRVPNEKLWFYQELSYSSGKRVTQKKLKRGLLQWVDSIWSLAERLKPYATQIQYGIAWLFTLLLLGRALSWFRSDAQRSVKDENGDTIIDFDIQDIQKDIATFKLIKADSNDKVKRYNQIMSRLNLLDEKWLWTYDVKELKWILEQDYKEWFNIRIMNTVQLLGDPVYSFTQQEKNTLGELKQIYYNDGYMIGWEDGVLIWALSETVRWSLVSSAIWQKLETCYFNLAKSGLTCASSDGLLYNTDKNWFSPISNDDLKFPRAIEALGTFGSSKMYTLTNDDRLNDDNIYVQMYKNKSGSQTEFEWSVSYPLSEWFKTDHPTAFGSGGVGSFAIDGNFIVWSKGDTSLYQLWREDLSTEFVWRKLNIAGGDTVSIPFSEEARVYTNADTRYLQMFDPSNQTFTVYRSTPYKTTPWWDKNRNPAYFFQLRFELDKELEILDVYVQEWEKSNLYLMTADNIYKLPLHEYLDQYHAEMATE